MARKTILETCDVLVVGGGMAGTGAAFEMKPITQAVKMKLGILKLFKKFVFCQMNINLWIMVALILIKLLLLKIDVVMTIDMDQTYQRLKMKWDGSLKKILIPVLEKQSSGI